MIFQTGKAMRRIIFPFIFVYGIVLSVSEACGEMGSPQTRQAFKDYWYQGKAELTRYELDQARYGEARRGDAVLVFVTEDFLVGEQVKHERGEPDGGVMSVLKLNFTRNFLTGIYPYSMMTSVFTPVDYHQDHSLKVTTSVQEWCGHTYSQLNYRDGKFKGFLHSYFQSEADRDFELDTALLEDEIWTKIRLHPKDLPVGDLNMVPGLQYSRLVHLPSRVEKAHAELITMPEDTLQVYQIAYQSIPRRLEIAYDSRFPYTIVSWEESYAPGTGRRKWVKTRGVRTHSVWLDYWNKTAVVDSTFRESLGFK